MNHRNARYGQKVEVLFLNLKVHIITTRLKRVTNDLIVFLS
jgi:hypothetical protein